MNDRELEVWLNEQLNHVGGLSSMLHRLKDRATTLTTQALRPGDTEGYKHRLEELNLIIDMFEHFSEYADTETETADG